VLTASLAAVLALNAARNYVVSGDLVVIASHGGLNLYIGNHEGADGTYTPVPGITPSIAGQAIDSKRVAESRVGRSLSPGEVSSFFARQAIDWVIGHPFEALRLTVRKIAIFLNAVDVPLNYSLPFYAREPGSLLRLLPVGPWLLLPLGLLGLVWSALRINRRGYWLWAMFVPVYGASVVAFFVADRYRMPVFVPLCATSGAALGRLFDLARARRFATLGWPAAALAALTLIAVADLGLDNGLGGEQTRRAVFLVEQGAIDEARRYVAQIAPEHSHPGVLQFRVGQAMSDAGRYAEAASLFESALAVDGPQPAIRLALGEALMKRGAVREAIEHLEAAVDAGFRIDEAGALLVRALVLAGRTNEAARRLPALPDSVASGPSSGDIALDLGTVALEQGAANEAIRWMRIAVANAPNRAEAHEKLGLAIFLAGDAQSAAPYLERALELAPGSASVHLNLAAVYAALGRFADARRLASAARRLDPSEPRAAALLEALPR
jgi:tetratricopeptide (TPR) repeat protein